MKSRISTMLLQIQSIVVAVLLLSIVGIVAPLAYSQVVSSTKNAEQIAILHWYPANLTTQLPVGTGPYGVAFDGASVWVANNTSNNVTKIPEAPPR